MQTKSPIPQTPPLRAVREARGMSLRQVAQAANVDPTQLSRAERGLSSLSIDSLYRVCRVLGLTEMARLLRPYVRRGIR